jgi:hypothetical protein
MAEQRPDVTWPNDTQRVEFRILVPVENRDELRAVAEEGLAQIRDRADKLFGGRSWWAGADLFPDGDPGVWQLRPVPPTPTNDGGVA